MRRARPWPARSNATRARSSPSFNPWLYFRIGYYLARRTVQFLYRVRMGYSDERALSEIEPNASVVFVMNHRSNMDYVIVAYFAAQRSALSYAVGEWARIWPLQALIRSLGAYFVRRDSRNPLYRQVLARYVQAATAAGVVQAVYPEGGLSRDGRLRRPKLGLINYMVAGFDPEGRARPRVRSRRHQLRPGAGGPDPGPGARPEGGGPEEPDVRCPDLAPVRLAPGGPPASGALAPLRVRVRELRPAGLDSGPTPPAAGSISAPSTRRPASTRWSGWAASCSPRSPGWCRSCRYRSSRACSCATRNAR